jgi:AraC-like DNA-binding protein
MKHTSKISGLLAIAVLASGIAVLGSGASAASPSKATKLTKPVISQSEHRMQPQRGGAPILSSAATLLGITEDQLQTKLHATTGVTLAAVAKDLKGWTTEEFASKLVTAETAKIDADVTAGKLTSAQATQIKTNLSAHITKDITTVHDGKGLGQGPQKGGRGPGNPFLTVATVLGITEDQLQTKLHATTGVSLAAVAKDVKGWTTEEFAAKLVAAETAKIDADVTAGKLTAAQATQIKSDLSTRITAAITWIPGKGHPFDDARGPGKAGERGGFDGKHDGKHGRGHNK